MLEKGSLHVHGLSVSPYHRSLLDLLSASSFYERRLQPNPKDKANEYSNRRYISLSIPVTLWNLTVSFSFLSRSY